MDAARNDAVEMARTFDMSFEEEDDLKCQLNVCELRPKELGDWETAAEADTLCESVQRLSLKNNVPEAPLNHQVPNYELRDYTDQNILLDELCAFTKVTNANGTTKVVRKSSILWALTDTKSSLSNERVVRVTQKAIEKVNKRTLLGSNCVVTAAPGKGSDEVALVWSGENLRIGDWCFFLKEDRFDSLDDLLVGRIVGFEYIVAKSAREKQYTWNSAPVKTNIEPSLRRGIKVLASWYEYRENGKIIPIESGAKHFFIDINHYIGTTKHIGKPSEGKVNLESTETIFLNQQLLNLVGMYFSHMCSHCYIVVIAYSDVSLRNELLFSEKKLDELNHEAHEVYSDSGSE